MFSSPKLAVLAILAAQFAGIALSHPSSQRPAKRFTPLDLGLAKTFGAIAATTLTSTGDTLITGDCGTSPGTSITGFPPYVKLSPCSHKILEAELFRCFLLEFDSSIS